MNPKSWRQKTFCFDWYCTCYLNSSERFVVFRDWTGTSEQKTATFKNTAVFYSQTMSQLHLWSHQQQLPWWRCYFQLFMSLLASSGLKGHSVSSPVFGHVNKQLQPRLSQLVEAYHQREKVSQHWALLTSVTTHHYSLPVLYLASCLTAVSVWRHAF